MKKLFVICLFVLLFGCSSNNEIDKYYLNILKTYQFDENSYILLTSNNKNVANIAISANNNLAYMSIETDSHKIEQYYIDNNEYVLLSKNNNKEYYVVEVDKIFDKPMDIFVEMVFDPSKITKASYKGSTNINNQELILVEARINNQNVKFYFEQETNKIKIMEFKDNSTLIFDNINLSLPDGFKNAQKADNEIINEFIDELTNSIKE